MATHPHSHQNISQRNRADSELSLATTCKSSREILCYVMRTAYSFLLLLRTFHSSSTRLSLCNKFKSLQSCLDNIHFVPLPRPLLFISWKLSDSLSLGVLVSFFSHWRLYLCDWWIYGRRHRSRSGSDILSWLIPSLQLRLGENKSTENTLDCYLSKCSSYPKNMYFKISCAMNISPMTSFSATHTYTSLKLLYDLVG